MDQTLQDVSKSIDQLFSHLSISNIEVPRFDENRDVFEFIADFELATSMINDDQKSILLPKSFPKGRARVWFETELKPAIKRNSPWSSLKRLLIERFSDQEDKDRHFKKLKDAKYNVDSDQRLVDFTEDLVFSYQKAHGDKYDDEACIKFVKASIPPNIMSTLALIPEFKAAKTSKELIKASKLFDTNYRRSLAINNESKVNTSELASLLKDLIKKSESTQAVVASLQEKYDEDKRQSRSSRTGRGSPSISPERRSWSPRRQVYWRDQHYRSKEMPRPSSPNYTRNRSPERYEGRRMSPEPYRRDISRYDGYQSTSNEENKRSNRESAPIKPCQAFDDEVYYGRFSRPPNPCETCQGMHWNRHCPLNLK